MSTVNLKECSAHYQVCGKYRWQITDQYGWNIEPLKVKLDTILTNQIQFNETGEPIQLEFKICLQSNKMDFHRQIICVYKQVSELMITYSLLDRDMIRIQLPCNSLERAEELVDLIREGENLKPFPLYSSSFKNK